MVTAELPIASQPLVTFDTSPERYRHWRLSVDGRVATLTLDVDEDGGIRPGYALKLNSYDLGVDIEFHDALQRIRFEHPGVACVVITSAKDRMFCAGANIYMLGASTHAWKVNFCKFTNETRNGMEDSSRNDGLRFVAALNGTTAGGGYEIALACDEIVMVDDRSSAVSLPEVPLLGVLPGTGGLTRVVDKRKVRRDIADLFCTNPDGVRAERAKSWNLVDHIAPPAQFAALVAERAQALCTSSPRPAVERGIELRPLERVIDAAGYHYRHVDVRFDHLRRLVTLVVRAPREAQPQGVEGIVAAGDAWWPLALARELDDALLLLRTNEAQLGLLVIRTEGDPEAVLAADQTLLRHRDHWLVRETIGMLRRTFARIDVTSRSAYAIVDANSCFAGLLYELALAADRSYMLDLTDGDENAPEIALDEFNFGLLPMVNGRSRLETHFLGTPTAVAALSAEAGRRYRAAEALAQGLITLAPDDLDWEDELRMAFEERTALSPDALTAMEANLRFAGSETLEAKVFGRLSAWQNWVFIRPNATGERGALNVFGTGSRPQFDWKRV
ncbi:benzoyl-CoA-dihydrodiol lyase [bacterium]|nr:MAG: benzoyl-CoA-dihydrodiol lyase [bacterium]